MKPGSDQPHVSLIVQQVLRVMAEVQKTTPVCMSFQASACVHVLTLPTSKQAAWLSPLLKLAGIGPPLGTQALPVTGHRAGMPAERVPLLQSTAESRAER